MTVTGVVMIARDDGEYLSSPLLEFALQLEGHRPAVAGELVATQAVGRQNP